MKKVLIILLYAGFVFAFDSNVLAQTSEDLFQQGMMKAEGEGNLEEAIKIYNKLVSNVNAKRSLRAKALMQVGICYEKLGKNNAQNAYKKLVSEFSDQSELVEQAKNKLKQLNQGQLPDIPRGLVTEQLKTEPVKDFSMTGVSPDGRYLIYMDWSANVKEAMKFDLVTGKADSITTGNTWRGKNWSSPSDPICLPDGKNIAYVYENEHLREIRTVDYNGENTQTILSGPKNEIPWLETYYNNGKYLLGIGGLEKEQKLYKISLEDKTVEQIATLKNGEGVNFKFSPDDKYLAYMKFQGTSLVFNDIFVLSLIDKKETQITNHKRNDFNPVWSPDGESILFLTNRMGNNDLYKIGINDGEPEGKPQIVKRNLGDHIQILGLDKNNSLYYRANNSRDDLFLLNLEDVFKGDKLSLKPVTGLKQKYGGILPNFSSDGRYITYLSGSSNKNGEDESDRDRFLGQKYHIGIYDTEQGVHKELNPELYFNHSPGLEKAWHVPSWSHDGQKILLHARVKEKYEGGFYMIDVNTEEITPVLTTPECKSGTEYKRFGHSMMFSEKGDKIYYLSSDWKKLFEYNYVTKKNKLVIDLSDKFSGGFNFEGFLDKEETVCIVSRRGGLFSYDLNSKELKNIAGKDYMPAYFGKTTDNQFYYLLKLDENRSLIRRSFTENEPDKTVLLKEILPGNDAHGGGGTVCFSPDGNKVVFARSINPGSDTFKITGIFEDE